MILRTLFLFSIASLQPCFYDKAFSKYFLDVISMPFLSSNRRAKSLRTHKNEGKVFISSSNTDSLFFWSCLLRLIFVEGLWWRKLVRITINERLSSAFSLILPRLLYIRKLDKNIDKMKILISRSLFY